MKTRLIVFVLIFVLALAAVPAFAQDSHTVAFDGFSFTFDIATNVEIEQYPGDPVEGAGPGFSDAAFTQFKLYSIVPDPVNGPAFPLEQVSGAVRFYSLEDVAQYDFMQEKVDQLKALLAEKPDLLPFTEVTENFGDNTLPFLPIYTHGQLLRAQPKYVETDTLEGIAFITASRADAAPFVNNEFTYTFQGLSKDGQYYVSITFNPLANQFPAQLENFDPAAYDWEADLKATIETLNMATAADFTPSLDTLDAIVASIQIAS